MNNLCQVPHHLVTTGDRYLRALGRVLRGLVPFHIGQRTPPWPKGNPTLTGIEAKIRRSSVHLSELERIWSEQESAYTFRCEIHRDGFDHVYYSENAPPPDPDWGLFIGDAVHCLRVALDHLACQLVVANGGTPTESTQFPIRNSRCRPNPSTGIPEPRPCEVSGGIHPAALAIIEEVQPYNRNDTGERLWALHQLDVIDKHRRLLVTTAVADSVVMSWDTSAPDAPPEIVGKWFNRSGLEAGKPAARFTYAVPYLHHHPNLKLIPGIAFSEGSGPVAGDPVVAVVGGWLTECVEFDVVPRLRPFITP